MRWLVPGGHLALLWSYPPWHGSQAWQRALADSMQHWMREAAATERVPADLDRHLAEEPHATLLEAAGFTIVGDFEFLDTARVECRAAHRVHVLDVGLVARSARSER